MEPPTLHVLLVDDSPDDRVTLRRLLARAATGRSTISEADSAARALATCQAAPPDCILLAHRLPAMDGLALLAALRAVSDAPIVLLATAGSEDLAVAALQQGAQDYQPRHVLTPERLRLSLERAVAAVKAAPAAPTGPQAWEDSRHPFALPETAEPGLCPLRQNVCAQRHTELTRQAQASEQRMRLAIEAAQLMPWEWDIPAGHLVFTAPNPNPFGIPPGHHQIPVATLNAAIYPPDRPAFAQAVTAMLTHSGPAQIQLRLQIPSGPLCWLEARGLVQHDSAGRPLRALGVSRDISAEQQRAASQTLHLAISRTLRPELDFDATVQALARLPLPSLADTCTIFLRDAAGQIRPTHAHVGPPPADAPPDARPDLALLDALPRAGVSGLLQEVLNTGIPQILAAVPPDLAHTVAGPPLRSALLVPLSAQDQTLGVMLLGRTADDWPYDRGDLLLAQGLARRGTEALLQASLRAAACAAELAAETALARLEALITSAPNGIAYLDHNLRYVLVNPALATLNGRPITAHLGASMAEMVPPVAQNLEPILRRVLNTGVPVHEVEFSAPPISPGGEPSDWLISIFPVAAPGGGVSGVGVILSDITARRRTEAALRASEARLHMLAEHAPDVIFRYRFAPDLALEYLSAAVEPLTGYPREAFFRDPDLPFRLIPPDDQSLFQRIATDFTSLLQPITLRWQHQDGHTRWAELNLWLVYDTAGQPQALEGIARDISERKQAEQALAAHSAALSRSNAVISRALQLKDAFLAMMSHELRTPLSAILTLSEAMDAELYGPLSPAQREVLAMVSQRGQHLLDMLAAILDLAQLEAGTASLELQPVDIGRLCRAAIDHISGAAQQKGVLLRCWVAEGVAGLRADKGRLRQILDHLLSNAVKFSTTDGSVGLEVYGDPQQEQLRLVIWDTGIGIAQEDLANLFQPFVQIDGRLARQYEGIGLGLRLVQHLVALHGGSISLASAPGQGSRFTVALPWPAAEHTAPPALESPAGHVAPHPPQAPTRQLPYRDPPLRVVIADAHEPTLERYAELMQQHGSAVAVARTGPEALAQVRAQHPEVVILALQLPDLDGPALIQAIRAEPGLDGAAIIALSALTLPGDRKRCLTAGANAYRTRPVTPRALYETIVALLTSGVTCGALWES